MAVRRLTPGQVTINDFLNHELRHVFDCIPTRDLVFDQLGLVSRQWSVVDEETRLLRSKIIITITNFDYCVRFDEIVISHLDPKLCHQLLTLLPNIAWLDLWQDHNVEANSEMMDCIIQLVTGWAPCLKVLSLNLTPIEDVSPKMQHLLKVINEAPVLENLTFYPFNHKIFSSQEIAPSLDLSILSRLHSVNIDSRDRARILLNSLERYAVTNNQLKSIEIGCFLDTIQCADFLALPSQLAIRFQALDIDCRNMMSRQFIDLCDHFRSLTKLRINKALLPLGTLVRSLARLPSLSQLTLRIDSIYARQVEFLNDQDFEPETTPNELLDMLPLTSVQSLDLHLSTVSHSDLDDLCLDHLFPNITKAKLNCFQCIQCARWEIIHQDDLKDRCEKKHLTRPFWSNFVHLRTINGRWNIRRNPASARGLTPGQVSISDFSNHELLQVFCRIPLRDLIFLQLGLVCRQWNEVYRQICRLHTAINIKVSEVKQSRFAHEIIVPQLSPKLCRHLVKLLPNIAVLSLSQSEAKNTLWMMDCTIQLVTAWSVRLECLYLSLEPVKNAKEKMRQKVLQLLDVINHAPVLTKLIFYYLGERIFAFHQSGASIDMPILSRLQLFSFNTYDSASVLLNSFQRYAITNDHLKVIQMTCYLDSQFDQFLGLPSELAARFDDWKFDCKSMQPQQFIDLCGHFCFLTYLNVSKDHLPMGTIVRGLAQLQSLQQLLLNVNFIEKNLQLLSRAQSIEPETEPEVLQNMSPLGSIKQLSLYVYIVRHSDLGRLCLDHLFPNITKLSFHCLGCIQCKGSHFEKPFSAPMRSQCVEKLMNRWIRGRFRHLRTINEGKINLSKRQPNIDKQKGLFSRISKFFHIF